MSEPPKGMYGLLIKYPGDWDDQGSMYSCPPYGYGWRINRSLGRNTYAYACDVKESLERDWGSHGIKYEVVRIG